MQLVDELTCHDERENTYVLQIWRPITERTLPSGKVLNVLQNEILKLEDGSAVRRKDDTSFIIEATGQTIFNSQ